MWSHLYLRVLTLGLVVTGSIAAPCDIYASGGTPCVAAHSTTRKLFDNYTGALYQVKRGSDGATTEITTQSGIADAAAQDSFCAGTTCLITVIYDQSGHGNHLTQAPPGGFRGPDVNGYDNLASAVGAPVKLNGRKAYGVFISPGTGYRNNDATGTATGDEAEGMYAVFDGTHFNNECCFDYGNAETNSLDNGDAHMETIYFGGDTNGPYIKADIENGLYATNNHADNGPAVRHQFVTAVVKGNSGNHWSIRGGDAASGALSTFYSGVRPSGYSPMKKEGAIILGIGGDNSDWAQGTFYEGAMTSGYPSDSTEDLVQKDIVAAKYSTAPLTSGPGLSVGSSISFRATTSCCTSDYITHSGSDVTIQAVSSSSSSALKQQATWIVRTGLGNSGCYSFESKDTPGSFLRHSGFQIHLNANDGSKLFSEDATFCTETPFNNKGSNSVRSWSYPAHYFRHYNSIVYVASNGGVSNFDATSLFNDDASWAISGGFA